MNASYLNLSVLDISVVGVTTFLRILCNTRTKCIVCSMFRRENSHTSEAFLDLIYPLDYSAAVRWMEEIRTGKQPRELDFRIFRKSGELRHIQCRGAITFDSSGKPVRFIGMAQDITERKLAEIQIRQQIERLSALRKIDQAISTSSDLKVTLDLLI